MPVIASLGRRRSSGSKHLMRDRRIEALQSCLVLRFPRNRAAWNETNHHFSAHPVSCPSYQAAACPVPLRHQPVRADGETRVTCAATCRAPALGTSTRRLASIRTSHCHSESFAGIASHMTETGNYEAHTCCGSSETKLGASPVLTRNEADPPILDPSDLRVPQDR
jgi:hypothetical protein